MPSIKPSSKTTVVGGTQFDSAKGARYLLQKGIATTAVGISTQPSEQSDLYLNPPLVKQKFEAKVKPQNCSELILYCNSLSFVVPWQEIYPQKKIYELTQYYKLILKEANLPKLAIIVAEETTINNLENFVSTQHICDPRELNIFSRLDVINQLESMNEADQLILLRSLIKEYQNLGYTEILMGCTHLDQEEFDHLTEVKVYQPGLTMLREYISDRQKLQHK